MKNIICLIILLSAYLYSGDLKQDLKKNEYVGEGLQTSLFAVQSRTGLPEGRAVWISRFEYNTAEGIRSLIDKAAEANCNLIFFQVRGQGDAFYFSNYEPWSDRLGGSYPGFDPLQVAIDRAHSYGMELHAYINVFPMWKGSTPPSSSQHIYNTHPEWVMVDYYGNTMDPAGFTYAFGSPGIPEFQDHLFNVAMDIIENYYVDGIHLDYIRYPGNDYSYDSVSVARFLDETGLDAYSHATEYSDWRREQVETVVSRIYQGMMQRKPEITLSAAVWGNYPTGRNYYFQDSHHWCQANVIDLLCPMIYTENTDLFVNYLSNHVYDSFGKFVFAGIGAYMHSTIELTLEQIQAARDQGAEGITIFSGSDLTNSLINNLVNGPFPDQVGLPAMTWKDYVHIQHQPHPDSEDTTNAYLISASITSTVQIDTDSVLLIYRSLESDGWDTTQMHNIAGNTYSGSIPPVSNSYVNYYISARNDSNYHATSPRWAPQFFNAFNVFPDNLPPRISNVSTANLFLLEENPLISSVITDNLGVDTENVFLNYMINMSDYESVVMQHDGNYFWYEIPEYLNLGDTINFWISAGDLSQNHNVTNTEEMTIVTGMDDFEEDEGNWLMGQNWEYQSSIVFSGQKALRIRPTDPVPQNPFIITRNLLDPDIFEGLSVSFASYRDIQETDSCFFEVSSDGGVNWTSFLSLGDADPTWKEYSVSIPDWFYAGSQTGIRFRFRYQSSATQDQYEGWVLDRFQLKGNNIAAVPTVNLPATFKISQNFPNPFNARTVIPLRAESESKLFISVYSITGDEVASWKTGIKPGLNLIPWDISEHCKSSVASGVYFIHLRTDTHTQTIKALLLK